MKKIIILLAVCLPTVFSIANALSVSGDIQLIAPPSSVMMNALESDTNGWAFTERQNVVLQNNLSVDWLAANDSAGTIAMGTTINSTFLHFDPVGANGGQVDIKTIMGSLTFDTPILGMIWTGAPCPPPCPLSPMNLDASDYLGNPGTLYPTGELGRGFEVDPFYASLGSQDFATSNSNLTVMISASAVPTFSDQLRVITVALPEPNSIGLLLIGMLLVAGQVRRRAI